MEGLYPAYCLISLYTMRKCEQQDRCVLPLIANLTFRPYIDWNMYQGPDTQMYTSLLSYTLYMYIRRRTAHAVVYFVSLRATKRRTFCGFHQNQGLFLRQNQPNSEHALSLSSRVYTVRLLDCTTKTTLGTQKKLCKIDQKKVKKKA